MHLFSKPSLLVALAPTLAFSSAIPHLEEERGTGFKVDCDAAENPTWDDCKAAYKTMHHLANKHNGIIPMTTDPTKNAAVWTHNSCSVAVADMTMDRGGVPWDHISLGIQTLQETCMASQAGGNAANNDGSMSVSIYTSKGSPALQAVQHTVTEAENDVQRRDGQTWTTGFTIKDAAPAQYRQQVLDAQPGGSSWALTNSESQSTTWEASASVSADLFEIFTVSASVDYKHDQTLTWSTTSTIKNKCAHDQTGTLYWYPRYTQYHGSYSGDGPKATNIYVPDRARDGKSALGVYRFICSS